jgi:hypothetical protein
MTTLFPGVSPCTTILPRLFRLASLYSPFQPSSCFLTLLADGPDAALTQYEEQKAGLHPGRRPRQQAEAVRGKDICNAFLPAKQNKVDASELSPRPWAEYQATMDLLVKEFGKGRLVVDLRPTDFGGLRATMAQTSSGQRS